MYGISKVVTLGGLYVAKTCDKTQKTSYYLKEMLNLFMQMLPFSGAKNGYWRK